MERVVVTQALLDFFAKKRVFSAPNRVSRWKAGDRLTFRLDAQFEPYSQIFTGNRLPLGMGAFSYSHSELSPRVIVHRYCSIGARVRWIGGPHPAERISTSPVTYDAGPLSGIAAYLHDVGQQMRLIPYPADDQSVRIGHDVWIGDDAAIFPGVTIGDGAVVGACTLVRHDVPPYAVVVGNPGRVLRMRFPDALVERLLRVRWWQFGPDVVQSLPMDDPARFLDELEERIAAEPPRLFNPARFTGEDILRAALTRQSDAAAG